MDFMNLEWLLLTKILALVSGIFQCRISAILKVLFTELLNSPFHKIDVIYAYILLSIY